MVGVIFLRINFIPCNFDVKYTPHSEKLMTKKINKTMEIAGSHRYVSIVLISQELIIARKRFETNYII